MSEYRSTIGNVVYHFEDLTTVLAKASPGCSRDDLAGLSAASAEERVSTQIALSDIPEIDVTGVQTELVRRQELLKPPDLAPSFDPRAQGTAHRPGQASSGLVDRY